MIDDREAGFTLIELLVVIIIIGILAAIAIPVFLNQRKKGVNASLKSDLRTAANAEESAFTDSQAYTAGTTLTGVKKSPGNLIEVSVPTASGGNDAFCVRGSNPKADANATGTDYYYYDSANGGLITTMVAAAGSCTGTFATVP
jgi:type IV pilus assembly protein PilA